MNAKLLSSLMATIERNLTDWIPMGVKELDVQSPAYCLFVWYQDYSGDFTPQIGVATQKLLDQITKTQFDDPNDKFDMIWRPQQVANLDVPNVLLLDECDIVEEEVEECYELLATNSGLFSEEPVEEEIDLDSEDDEEEDDDEDSDDLDDESSEDELSDEELIDKEFETLAPFREMMHRVAKNLQTVNWSKIMPVKDEFVVIVGDYVGYWLAEDFEQCVSEEQCAKLVESGLLQAIDEDEEDIDDN